MGHVGKLGSDTWVILGLYPLKENRRDCHLSEDQIQNHDKQEICVNAQYRFIIDGAYSWDSNNF